MELVKIAIFCFIKCVTHVFNTCIVVVGLVHLFRYVQYTFRIHSLLIFLYLVNVQTVEFDFRTWNIRADRISLCQLIKKREIHSILDWGILSWDPRGMLVMAVNINSQKLIFNSQLCISRTTSVPRVCVAYSFGYRGKLLNIRPISNNKILHKIYILGYIKQI